MGLKDFIQGFWSIDLYDQEAKVLSLDLETSPVSSQPLNKKEVSINLIIIFQVFIIFQG